LPQNLANREKTVAVPLQLLLVKETQME